MGARHGWGGVALKMRGIDNGQAVEHNPLMKPKNQAAVELGRLGGKAGRGPAKARTPEQCRAAAMVRWGRVKANAVQVSRG